MADAVFSLADLASKRGDDGQPIWLAVAGVVYDVSSGRDFYGPGGGYHVFAGHDVTLSFARTSLDPALLQQQDAFVPTDAGQLTPVELTEEEHTTLNQWIDKLKNKYPKMGILDKRLSSL